MNIKHLFNLFLLTTVLFVATVRPSLASSVSVEHIANTGIKITSGDKTVLIDALFSAKNHTTDIEKMELNKLAIEGADLVLVTNSHREHFSIKRTFNVMLRNPDTILISTPKVGRKLGGMLNKDRLITPKLNSLESAKYQYQDITVTAMNFPYSGDHHQKVIKNYAFLVEIDGFRALHVGDANVSDIAKHISEPIDLAIIPSTCITTRPCIEQVRNMNIKNVAFTHNQSSELENITAQVQIRLPTARLLANTDRRIELNQ